MPKNVLKTYKNKIKKKHSKCHVKQRNTSHAVKLSSERNSNKFLLQTIRWKKKIFLSTIIVNKIVY